MSTVPAAIVALFVLSAAGVLPVLALIGVRWIALPLAPLAGAIVAAVAATTYVAVGGTFMTWFVVEAVVLAAVVVVFWYVRPERRPWRLDVRRRDRHGTAHRWFGIGGAVAIAAACTWCLRGLATPTVGFDARALWLMRPGWFLQSHHQLLVNLRIPDLVLIQSPYPPLVSAATAVSWSVTGNHTDRLGVVVIALLNTCALAVAAFALVELGRRFALRLSGIKEADSDTMAFGTAHSRRAASRHARARGSAASTVPMVAGVVAAVLLVFVAFGITEPFMTNGYADPIWSLAAVGAVVYGLQMELGRVQRGAALLLVLVAGLSKDEGVATAVVLIGIIALRSLLALWRDGRLQQWWQPVALGVAEIAVVGSWPLLMRIDHARGAKVAESPMRDWADRVSGSYHGMTPYLHVLVVAIPVAVVGGLILSRVRRASGAGNDWWVWAGLASGALAVAGAFVTGTGALGPWLLSTVHRVTEFPAMMGWWIIAVWAVVASGACFFTERRSNNDSGADPAATPEQRERTAPPRRQASIAVE
jgi:hypothetical protein